MPLKFLNLNIWDKGMMLDKVIHFLKKEDADIINLQEVYDSQDESIDNKYRSLTEIKKQLEHNYFYYSAEWIDKTSVGKVDEGNLIISRFPILTSTTFFYLSPYGEVNLEELRSSNGDFSHLPRNIQKVNIKINNKSFSILNTHGPWGFDGGDNSYRLKMSAVIIDLIRTEENVILSGDFNTFPETTTIRNIEKHLVNVFKNELKTTFNLKQKKVPGNWAKSVVDMIFVSPHIKVIDHYCPNVDISDHLPLISILEI